MKKVNYTHKIIGLIFFSNFIFTCYSVYAQRIPINQKLTTSAWDYYNKQNFEKAIDTANECIKLFRGQAEIKQEELLKNNVTKPNTTPDEKEKKEIFSRGLVNDVGTCYYIQGLCYLELKDTTEAKKSFLKASKFPHAMCWDPAGWFWNISEAAFGKLRELKTE